MKKTFLSIAFILLFFNSVFAQFTQNFDSNSNIPLGWSFINGGDINTWQIGTPGSGTAYSGNNVAKIIFDSNVAHDDYLVTPQIQVILGVSDRITFMVKSGAVAYPDNFEVKLSTNSVPSASSFTITLLPETEAPANWTKIIINLNAYVGQAVYIGFHATSLDAYHLYLDNINNDTTPVCNYTAPIITNISQPNCAVSGSINLSGLPAIGTWTLHSSYYISGIPNSTVMSTTTGTGPSNTLSISNSSSHDKIYSFYFVDDDGCASPVSDEVTIAGCQYLAPIITNTIQPTCTNTGNVTLSGLPTAGTWTLYSTRTNIGSNSDPVVTHISGTGATANMPIANDNEYTRIYTFYFVDQFGNQSPLSTQVYVERKYFFVDWIEGVYQDTNHNGITDLGDQVKCRVLLNNEGLCDMGNANITLGTGEVFNQFASLGILNFPSHFPQEYFVYYNITEADILSGYVTLNIAVQPMGVGFNFSQSIASNYAALNTNGFRLHAFVDINQNGIKETSEPIFNLGDFKYTKSNFPNHTFSVNSSNGSYFIAEWKPEVLYNFSFEVNPNFSNYLISTTQLNNLSSAAGTGITDLYFPVICTQTNGDLQVNILPIERSPRPGFNYKNRIAYFNSFNTPISGSLSFTKNQWVSITAVSESGIINNSNGFTYPFHLEPFESAYVDVEMLVDTATQMGMLLTNNAFITLPLNDSNPQNNQSSVSQVVVNSWDPNDKTEVNGGQIVAADFSANDFLTYTIRFENTGTDSALKIRISDNLHPSLDEASVTMLGSSHPYTLVRDMFSLEWLFDPIDLPPGGKGFVSFKVKPKVGYTNIGRIIPNTAQIYFDYNPAINTNTCNTEFVSFLKNDDIARTDLTLYPNPVKNKLHIMNSEKLEQVEISSVLGQILYADYIDQTDAEIDLSAFPNGILLVKVKSDTGSKTLKIIKE